MTFKPEDIHDHMELRGADGVPYIVLRDAKPGCFVVFECIDNGLRAFMGIMSAAKMAETLNKYSLTRRKELFEPKDIVDGLAVMHPEGSKPVYVEVDNGTVSICTRPDAEGLPVSFDMSIQKTCDFLNENNYIRHEEDASDMTYDGPRSQKIADYREEIAALHATPAVPLVTMDKQYKTACGYDVTIYKTDVKSTNHPVHGAYTAGDGLAYVEQWTSTGKSNPSCLNPPPVCNLDLIECKPVHTVTRWFCLYKSGSLNMLETEDAIRERIKAMPGGSEPIAIFSHTFEIVEGEGL